MSSSLKSKVVPSAMMFMLLLTVASVSSPSVQAASSCVNDTDCRIPVTFKGDYVEDTCEVSINGASSSEVVVLPRLSTKLLQVDRAEAGSREFQIALNKCPASRSIDLRFIAAGVSAPPDSSTGNLQNESADEFSKNVQIRLSKAVGQQMVVGDGNSVQEYIIPSSGDAVTHYFLAGYYAKGTNAVTPGQVKATAGIELVYK